MDTGIILQRMLVAALRSSVLLREQGVGIFDGAPPSVAPPYLTVGRESVLDWGWKGGGGREHRFEIGLWHVDPALSASKTLLAEAVDAALAMPRAGDGVRLVMLRHLRSDVRRRPGKWTEGAALFRALVVKED